MKSELQINLKHNGANVAQAIKIFDFPEMSTKNIDFKFKLTHSMILSEKLKVTSVNVDKKIASMIVINPLCIDEIPLDTLESFFIDMEANGWEVEKINDKTIKKKIEKVESDTILVSEALQEHFDKDKSALAKAAGVSVQQVYNWISTDRKLLKLANGGLILAPNILKIINIPHPAKAANVLIKH